MTQAEVEHAVERFLAIGGRVMVYPDGRVEATISVAHVYSLSLDPDARKEREDVSRNLLRVEIEAPDTLADLTRQHGQPERGFIVWRAA